MKLYEVGGHVRDSILEFESKDVDYTVVINEDTFKNPNDAFIAMVEGLKAKGFKVFVEHPDVFTVRAMFPEDHEHSGVADFVMARKELGYAKGTRQPIVEMGTLMDDLTRRDFTVNAMAKELDGTVIDPFNGAKDLRDMILRTPLDAAVSFNDDPLRILRALRFSVTKSFGFSDHIIDAIKAFDFRLMIVVSDDRIRDELHKMFKHDTFNTLRILHLLQEWNPQLFAHIIMRENFWLMPTNKR
jgi:tRNA nucleotidyltransferase/poly(A) polymerase